MATKKKSPFDTWFKAQFRFLPASPAKLEQMRKDFENLKRQAMRIKDDLAYEERLSNQYTASLYAWNIKDKDKKKMEW